jgi:hypothetical protein
MVIASARNSSTPALRALFARLFGIAAFAWPAITHGAYGPVVGAFIVATAVVGRTEGLPWSALLRDSLVGIAVGVIAFVTLVVTEKTSSRG